MNALSVLAVVAGLVIMASIVLKLKERRDKKRYWLWDGNRLCLRGDHGEIALISFEEDERKHGSLAYIMPANALEIPENFLHPTKKIQGRRTIKREYLKEVRDYATDNNFVIYDNTLERLVA